MPLFQGLHEGNLWIPGSSVATVLPMAHDAKTGGHFGFSRRFLRCKSTTEGTRREMWSSMSHNALYFNRKRITKKRNWRNHVHLRYQREIEAHVEQISLRISGKRRIVLSVLRPESIASNLFRRRKLIQLFMSQTHSSTICLSIMACQIALSLTKILSLSQSSGIA